MRIALMVEYDGSQFHGWQAQPGLRTVQSMIENALTQVANEPVNIICAGRTDTGVHAMNQVIHFDSEKERNIRSWIYGANSFLPKDICIKWGKEMPNDFHARYSATSRRYQYIIYNSPVRPALLRSHTTWQYRQLDHHLMHEAAQFLVGENDFTSFRSLECQSKTPMRHLMQIQVTRKNNLIMLDLTANAFLHHMVRNITGVLMMIGMGKKPIEWAQEVLLAKDRKLGAETAPPYGLYLVNVHYPREFGITPAVNTPLFFDV